MTDHASTLRTIAEGFCLSGDDHIANKLRAAADEIQNLRRELALLHKLKDEARRDVIRLMDKHLKQETK